MREFQSLAAFAFHLAELPVLMAVELQHGLERVAEKVEETAKSEIGTYQSAVGPFPAWAELAEVTKEDRVSQGFTENDPLLRTGQMRDDITHEVGGLEAVIGTPETAETAQIMIYQEFGTTKIPPRPVLGPAAYRNKASIEKLIGAAVVTGMIGADAIHAALGYDFEVKK